MMVRIMLFFTGNLTEFKLIAAIFFIQNSDENTLFP